MNDPRWERIQALFEGAVRLPAEERAAFLDGACDDDGMRAEVEALLEADARGPSFTEAVGRAAADALGSAHGAGGGDAGGPGGSSAPADPDDDLQAGRTIGPYRIVRELDRGGMGRVFLAERADDAYRGLVAIKLVHPGPAAAGLAERFRTERQVLADLDHPNVARLLDGGTTPEGEPYLVMEYVEGEPIDAWCDRRGLSVEQRVRLVVKVCEAVQHAHASLVVHRDVKPSNILVTPTGEPKLLDFGIAKLLDPARLRELDLHRTSDARRVMTPASASPEQVRGEAVTTATDVYALGVLLYELLTGYPTYGPRSSDPVALPRAIQEEEPRRPSEVARLAVGEDEAAHLAEASRYRADPRVRASLRSTTPDRLARKLAGDLDTIVLMALRKEPERRYGSVAQLAGDLDRHLRKLPVLARGDSFGYLARRFVRRHRAGVAAAAAVVLGVAGLTGFYTARVAAERDRATLEARRAEEVSDFLVGLFRLSAPEQAMGRDVTARELLDRGAERIGRELSGEPRVQATMMEVMGDVYRSLGLYGPSGDLLESALVLREADGGGPGPALPSTLHSLGETALRRGEYSRGDSLLQRALALRRDRLPPSHPDLVRTLLSLGNLRDVQGDFEGAATFLDEAEAAARSRVPPDSTLLADAMELMAEHLKVTGDYDGAVERLREAVAILERLGGPDHPRTLEAGNGLADALSRGGRYAEARELQERLLEARRRILPEGHPMIGQAMESLAITLKYQGHPDQAEPLESGALRIFRDSFEGDHLWIAVALNNLANIRHDLRDLDGAMEMHRESLAMNRRLFGEDYPGLADSYNNMAAVLADMDDLEGALEMFRATLAHDRRLLGEEHPWIGPDMVAVGTTLARLGRFEEGMPLLRDGVDFNRRVAGERSPATGNALRELGLAHFRQGQLADAEPLLAEALDIMTEAYPGDPWETAVARAYLGACYSAAGRREEGDALMRSGYDRLVEMRGPDDWMSSDARALLERYGGVAFPSS